MISKSIGSRKVSPTRTERKIGTPSRASTRDPASTGFFLWYKNQICDSVVTNHTNDFAYAESHARKNPLLAVTCVVKSVKAPLPKFSITS